MDRRRTTPERYGGVLIITQDPSLEEVLNALVRELGDTVHRAASAEEALQAVDDGTAPDVILIDDRVADMGDANLCSAFRTHARCGSSFICVLSSQPNLDVEHLLRSGADDYALQPVDNHVLLTTLRAALRTQALKRTLMRKARHDARAWMSMVVAHELNNPLAILRACLDEVTVSLQDSSTSGPLGEALADGARALDRLHQATALLQPPTQCMPRAAFEEVPVVEIRARAKEALEKASQPHEIMLHVPKGHDLVCLDLGALDAMMDAVVSTAAARCTGLIACNIYINALDVSVVFDLQGAPPEDPDVILEPSLAHHSSGSLRFDAGLSWMEAAFASRGGTVYSRPIGSTWRFGLKIPHE